MVQEVVDRDEPSNPRVCGASRGVAHDAGGGWLLMSGRGRIVVVLAMTIAVAVGLVAPGGAAEKKGKVTYFSAGITPGSYSYVTSITAGPDGNLWFTESGVTDGRIGRITRTGEITEFSAGLSAGAGPSEITAGPDGNLWFAEAYPGVNADGESRTFGRIGRITPKGVITEFSAGITPGSSVGGITAGPDANLWFTEDAVDADRRAVIGRITPAGEITEFSAGLTPQASVNRITAGPDANLWFTETTFEGGGGLDANGFPVSGSAVGKVGRITPKGVITEFSAGITGEAYFITAGCDGNLWFADFFGRIGRITPKGKATPFSAGNPTVNMGGITAGPDGNVWFTKGGGVEDGGSPPEIGRITPTGKVTEFSTGITPNGTPGGITAGPDGNLWFTESQTPPNERIGRIGAGPSKKPRGKHDPTLPAACPRGRS
jgi:streptogramin lyase